MEPNQYWPLWDIGIYQYQCVCCPISTDKSISDCFYSLISVPTSAPIIQYQSDSILGSRTGECLVFFLQSTNTDFEVKEVECFIWIWKCLMSCSRTDSTDLIISNPNSSVRRRRRLDTKPAADRDDRLLQLANVPTNTLTEQRTSSPESEQRETLNMLLMKSRSCSLPVWCCCHPLFTWSI